MKKSKLLQSSKEMLSRSFNPTKCKTSLRLASARLKLLKNKKDVQVKQMRKEIAQLLESGQERTARMRVEHVIREEKMVAAFDLLEIYCELIIARLPIIESQKNCPIDLKEAITSVIFASLRCGDVTELLDIRKQLTAKYGKDFATAAIELRPQSGVGRMLVEKLSASAPDVQTKTKILSAIAEEHNVKWEHEVLEEKDSISSSDVSSGASYYGKESKPYVEQPHFEATHSQAHPNTDQMHSQSTNIGASYYGKESKPYVEPPHFEATHSQAHPNTNQMDSQSTNTLHHDPRISMEAEKVTIAQPSVVSTTYQHEARPQGDYSQGGSNVSALGRHKWNMEFKDATSAAQAAAESAEMASMAAKAAAELSMQNRIMRQESTESHASDTHVSKDEGPQIHSIPHFSREQIPKETVKESYAAPTGSHYEKIDKIYPYDHKTAARSKDDNRGSPEQYNHSASLKSESSSIDDPVCHGTPVVDHYSEKNPMDEVSRVETSTNQQKYKHEEEIAKDWARETESHQEKKIEEQHSISSSRSHSSMSDDVNIFANSENAKYESDAGETPFVDIAEVGTHEGETSHRTSSHEEVSVFYDKFDSETDDHGFDLGPKYDEHDSGFNLSSSTSLDPYSWNSSSQLAQPVSPAPPPFFARENSPPIFSEDLTSSRDNGEVDNFAPITYDDSDGPNSDIEEDKIAGLYKMEDTRSNVSRVNRKESSTLSFEDINRHSVGSPPFEQSGSHIKQPSSSSDSEIEDLDGTKTEVKNFDIGSPVRPEKPTLRHKNPPQEFRDIAHESGSGGEEGLTFGKLTGGLRHKDNNTLTFLKKRVDASSSVKKDIEMTAETSINSAKTYAVEPSKESSTSYKKKNMLDLHAVSNSDSSEDDGFLERPSGRRQGTYTHTDAKTKLSLGALNSTFASDSSDLDDDPPKESFARKSHLQSGISRRTRAAPPSSRTSTHSKTNLRSEANDIDDDLVRQPVNSYNCETASERNSDNWENSEQPASGKVPSKSAKSNVWGSPEHHHTVKTSMSKQEYKTGLMSELQDAPAYLIEKSSNSYLPYTGHTAHSFNRNSNELDISEYPTSAKTSSKPTTSNLLGTSEKPNSAKATSTAMQKPFKPKQKPEGSISSEVSKSETLDKISSKITQKSSTVEQPSKPPQKPEASVSNEGSKSETSNKISSKKSDSTKRASHVHPKLPDYDTLFQSLRAKRS